MRKLVIILMATLLMTAVSSCHKDDGGNSNAPDGIYNPAKKIHKVFREDSTSEMKKSGELWNWNGSRLESIEHGYTSSQWSWTESFIYEDNTLARIVGVGGLDDAFSDFTYHDGRLYKICTYFNSVLAIEYTFMYGDDSKVSEVSAVYYINEEEGKSFEKHPDPLWLFLPEEICDRLDMNRLRHASKDYSESGLEKGTFRFTWSGDNISSVLEEFKYEGENDGDSFIEITTFEFSMEYDNKHNPQKGLLSLINDQGWNGAVFYSKNNVKDFSFTQRIDEYVNGVLTPNPYTDKGEYHCSFEYDTDGYPITINYINIDESGNSWTSADYYEYL